MPETTLGKEYDTGFTQSLENLRYWDKTYEALQQEVYTYARHTSWHTQATSAKFRKSFFCILAAYVEER